MDPPTPVLVRGLGKGSTLPSLPSPFPCPSYTLPYTLPYSTLPHPTPPYSTLPHPTPPHPLNFRTIFGGKRLFLAKIFLPPHPTLLWHDVRGLHFRGRPSKNNLSYQSSQKAFPKVGLQVPSGPPSPPSPQTPSKQARGPNKRAVQTGARSKRHAVKPARGPKSHAVKSLPAGADDERDI